MYGIINVFEFKKLRLLQIYEVFQIFAKSRLNLSYAPSFQLLPKFDDM
jgi:hypothetical protein